MQKRILKLELLLASIAIMAGCGRYAYPSKHKSIMERLKTDSAYLINKLDIDEIMKRCGDQGSTTYIDSNNYRIEINWSAPYGKIEDYSYIVFPPGQYYSIGQIYDGDGYIRLRDILYFNMLWLTDIEHYDEFGNLTLEKQGPPRCTFTIDEVYRFLERKGLVDSKGKNSEYLVIEYLYNIGGWQITINNHDQRHLIQYFLGGKSGKVLEHKDEHYF